MGMVWGEPSLELEFPAILNLLYSSHMSYTNRSWSTFALVGNDEKAQLFWICDRGSSFFV